MQRITNTAARLVCFGMLAGLFAAAGTAQADTHTWDSGGGDNNFNTGANWDQSDTAPVDSDSLAFGAGATSPA